MKIILDKIKINIYIFSIVILIFPEIFSSLSFEYPTAITLPNGNILVVEKNGIFLCNSIFSTIINIEVNFTDDDKIQSVNDLSKVILKRELNYIFCLVNYKLYMFNLEGRKLFIIEKLISISSPPEYCTLCPLNIYENWLYYIIGYFDNNNHLNLLLYNNLHLIIKIY